MWETVNVTEMVSTGKSSAITITPEVFQNEHYETYFYNKLL